MMKHRLRISALMLTTVFSATAFAGDRDAVVGAMVGGGAGAYIGNSVHGRNGALIGGALGAMTGVALATQNRDRERVIYERAATYEDDGDDRDYVYEEQPPVRVIYEPAYRVIYRPAPAVVYRPVTYVVRNERYDRYNHHEWRHDRRHHRDNNRGNHRGKHRGHDRDD